ncbi:unnamed protein product, partial [Brachionus calyciflorus]
FFNSGEYEGIIRKIGTKDECSSILEDIVGENTNSKIKEISSQNKLGKNSDQNCLKKNLKILEDENIKLKKKVIELTNALQCDKTEIEKLNEKIQHLNNSINQYKNSFTPDDIHKISKMCSAFQSIFSKTEEELSVPLSQKFFDIMVPESDLLLINEYLDEISENQGDNYFKKILSILIKDKTVFRTCTASKIKKDYTKKISAVLSLVKERDTKFSAKNLTNLINRMVQNSKKNKENNPMTPNLRKVENNSSEGCSKDFIDERDDECLESNDDETNSEENDEY